MFSYSIDRMVVVTTLIAVLGTGAIAAEEPIAVVVARNSEHAQVGFADIAAIFRRKRLYWDDGERVIPVNLPAADPRRREFSSSVFGRLPEELTQYWNEMYYHGIVPPQVLDSSEAVLRFVAATPEAVGYIPLCQADQRVQVVLVIGGSDNDANACRRGSSPTPQK